ncbi:DUF3558 domain-containing protein [Amycolatopsis sp. FU40]|uniref:DUF3558 domain-containing protein n=1 Tax=Amycolatopsis sp. FU40 TaxID=2914159 RepID=UPI001F31A7B6|nr:DUF3558 domain-containing protein [Amycolatopsis sp. FU40]UKD53595.1 DUF3558 domain-containing protein [Amycolatopsis sp. FU40]
MTSRNAAVLSLAAAAVLLSSCSAEPGKAAPTTAPPSTSAGPRFGAPPVPVPLDASSLEKEPCAALTPDQVASLGAPFKGNDPKPDDATGPSCNWKFATTPASSVGGTLTTKDPGHGGISGIYSKKQFGGVTKFEPFTVNSYPGVVYDPADNSPAGLCTMVIGLRDDLGYVIDVSLDGLKNPFADSCELGKKVAGYVIQYLKKGGH